MYISQNTTANTELPVWTPPQNKVKWDFPFIIFVLNWNSELQSITVVCYEWRNDTSSDFVTVSDSKYNDVQSWQRYAEYTDSMTL